MILSGFLLLFCLTLIPLICTHLNGMISFKSTSVFSFAKSDGSSHGGIKECIVKLETSYNIVGITGKCSRMEIFSFCCPWWLLLKLSLCWCYNPSRVTHHELIEGGLLHFGINQTFCFWKLRSQAISGNSGGENEVDVPETNHSKKASQGDHSGGHGGHEGEDEEVRKFGQKIV